MITVLLVVAHLLGLVSSVHAIMTVRTAQGAIAWAVSLNTFPYVAVPAYWIFGRRKFESYANGPHVDPMRRGASGTAEGKTLLTNMWSPLPGSPPRSAAGGDACR